MQSENGIKENQYEGARAAKGFGAPLLESRVQSCLLTSVSLTVKLEQREHWPSQWGGPEIPSQPSWLGIRHFLHSQISVENQGWLSGDNTQGAGTYICTYSFDPISYPIRLTFMLCISQGNSFIYPTEQRSRFSQGAPLSSQPGLLPDGARRKNEERKMIKPIHFRTKRSLTNLNILFPTHGD